VAVGHEELVKPGTDEVGQRHLMPQAHRQGGGVHGRQPRAAGAVLAPLDENLAQASVVPLVGGETETFRADDHRGGVSMATSRQRPTDVHHHSFLPKQSMK
jgi:hypothetical protein